MTATDELRRMLDERGVEWDELVGHPVVVGTAWHDRDGYPCTALEHADDIPDGMLGVQANLTPEQAIEATLGRGTCRDVRSADHTIAFECSECGCWVAYDEYWETGIYVLHETGQEHIHPRYCPNCGAEVVE